MFLTTLMHTIDCVSASTDSPTKIGVVNYKIIKFISILIHQPPPLSLYCFFPSLAPPGHEPPLPGHEPPLPPSSKHHKPALLASRNPAKKKDGLGSVSDPPLPVPVPAC